MRTIEATIQATDLDTMANLVMNDPGRKARIEARRERDRKARENKVTRRDVERTATTTGVVALALMAGYALALL